MTWPRWRLKLPASWLFTQSFIQPQIKENIKAPRHWPLCGEFTGTGEFPAQMASNAENDSIWWTIIGSDNGLSPGGRQAIIWASAGILLIRWVGTNFSEILCGIYVFSFKKMHLKMSSAKWRQLLLGYALFPLSNQWNMLENLFWKNVDHVV